MRSAFSGNRQQKESAACLRLMQSHGLPALCRAMLLNAEDELIYYFLNRHES